MNLNHRQQTILKVFCAYLVITMLWPPFYIGVQGGGVFGLGFGFLFAPPHDRGRVDAAQLLAQRLLGAVIAGVLMLQSKNWTQSDRQGFVQRIGPALNEGFKRSKWWLVVIAVFALIKLFTPSVDQGKQAAFALILFIGYLPIYAAIWIWHTQRAYRGISAVQPKAELADTSWKRIALAVGVVFVIVISAMLFTDDTKPWSMNWGGTTDQIKSFDDLTSQK